MSDFLSVIPINGGIGGTELRERPGEVFCFWRDGREVRPLSVFEDEFVRSALAAGQATAKPIDFDRRVRVEQRLLDVHSGKAPLPTREECRELAHLLGIPEQYSEFTSKKD